MAVWKKVLTASGTDGALIGTDLIDGYQYSSPPPNVSDPVLRVQPDGTVDWDTAYTHDTFSVPNLDGSVSTSASSEVIDSLEFGFSVNGEGHVSGVTQAAMSTRSLNLNDFGYSGNAGANYYAHPTVNGGNALTYDVNKTADPTAGEFISSISLGWEVDGWGHITSFNNTDISTAYITLETLGYSGDHAADNYEKWKIVTESGSAEIGSEGILAIEGADDISVSLSGSTLQISGNAPALGKITSITRGTGLSFIENAGSTAISVADTSNPDFTINLTTPETVGDRAVAFSDGASIGSNTAGFADGVTGHSHQVTVTSDGHTNKNTFLVVNEAGGLAVSDLSIAGNLAVTGNSVYMDTTEVAFADSIVQLNTDSTGQAYNATPSAMLFGHATLASGAKLINTVESFVLSGLVDTADAAASGGTATIGAPKPLECKHVVAGEAYFGKAWIQGGVVVDGGVEVSDYVRLSATTQPTGVSNGTMHFDGTKLWIKTSD